MKLFGKIGWHGQCSCCNGNKCKRGVKQEEERQWRRELEDEPCMCGTPFTCSG